MEVCRNTVSGIAAIAAPMKPCGRELGGASGDGMISVSRVPVIPDQKNSVTASLPFPVGATAIFFRWLDPVNGASILLWLSVGGHPPA